TTSVAGVPWAPHDVNGQDTGLMTGQKVIDKITDYRVRFMAQFGHNPANQSATAAVPFQIDRAVKIARAVNFCPPMGTPGLFCPDLDEVEFLFELWIAHDLTAQRSTARRDHMDHCLH